MTIFGSWRYHLYSTPSMDKRFEEQLKQVPNRHTSEEDKELILRVIKYLEHKIGIMEKRKNISFNLNYSANGQKIFVFALRLLQKRILLH